MDGNVLAILLVRGSFAALMLPSARSGCSRFILLLLTCTLLGSCTAHPRHTGFSGGTLRLDTETVGRMRHAAALKRAAGVAVSTVAAASTIGLLAPEVLGFFQNDEEELSRLEAALLGCVQRAERDINAERFGYDAQPPRTARRWWGWTGAAGPSTNPWSWVT